MNNSFFSRFTPKEPKFFHLLKEMSEAMVEASNLLAEMLQYADQQHRLDFYHSIKEQEKKGDKVQKKIFDELGTSFITPFDREDIHELTIYIDDVIDGIHSASKKIAIYNPNKCVDGAPKLAEIIQLDAKCILRAMDEIHHLRTNAKDLKECAGELHDYENQADDLYDEAIIRLFENEKDGIELVKSKEILSELEKTTDSAERVGKILQTIIVKYA